MSYEVRALARHGLHLLHCRVVPPIGLVGPLSQDFFADGTHVDVEEEEVICMLPFSLMKLTTH
jgi:hypothetical protein